MKCLFELFGTMHELKSKLKLLFHHFISHHPQPICHCHRQPWMTALRLQQATKKYQKNYAHESKYIDPALTTKTSITLQAHPWTDFSSRSKRKLHDMCQQSLKNIQKKVQYFRYVFIFAPFLSSLKCKNKNFLNLFKQKIDPEGAGFRKAGVPEMYVHLFLRAHCAM